MTRAAFALEPQAVLFICIHFSLAFYRDAVRAGDAYTEGSVLDSCLRRVAPFQVVFSQGGKNPPRLFAALRPLRGADLAMCGRYKRRSDQQRIAETFSVAAGLDETFLDPGDDFSPQSMQPVIHLNEDGERQIELMRWAFKLPDRPRPLFNARSEGIEHANFWKDAFLKGRCIVPADAIFEWKDVEKGKKNLSMNLSSPARNHLVWLRFGSFGKIQRRNIWNGPLLS